MSPVILAIITGMQLSAANAAPQLPADLRYEAARTLIVQHDGRCPPLDTLARDMVEHVTGDARYQGHDAIAWLLAWTFDPQTWENVPLIAIRNRELRSILELPADRNRFSWRELADHRPLQGQIDALAHRQGRGKLDPLESKVSDISERLALLRSVFDNQKIRLIPNPDSVLATWRTIPQTAQQSAVSTAWQKARTAFLANDASVFDAACQELSTALAALPAAYRPTDRLIGDEIRYNQLRPFRTAWRIMIVGAVLAAAALWGSRRWLDVVALVGLVAGFGMLSYGLWLRWTIAGSLPASNMFESLLFLSWGMGAFAILSMILTRDRWVPLTASFLGALALFLADVLPLDHYVRPIAPVLLDTIWMSIHVPIIMVSYSVLAMAALVAHAQIVLLACAPSRQAGAQKVDAVHTWYVHAGCLLLAVGILTGSMWAASSWGRYWGWDPKEVWSLIALLGYLAAMHIRVDVERTPRWIFALAAALTLAVLAIVARKLSPLTPREVLTLAAAVVAGLIFLFARGTFAAALKSILAFWLIIMTYVGVNFVLGTGLHSYGFGTGAVVRYMTLTGGIDLAIIALLTLIYLARRPKAYSAAPL